MIVTLNVGGTRVQTTTATLSSASSFFSSLLSNTPVSGEIFVDRDGTHIRHVINWLRGSRFLPCEDEVLEQLLVEADFYALEDMKRTIAARLSREAFPPLCASVRLIAKKV